MRIFTNATLLAKSWELRKDLQTKSLRQVHKVLVNESHIDFRNYTDGKFDYKMRRKMGFPYKKLSFYSKKRDKTFYRMRGISKTFKKTGSLPVSSKPQFSKRGSLRRLPINVDTGELRRKTFLRQPRKDVYHLGSSSVSASYVLKIGGLPNMVDRHFYGPRGIIKKLYKARRLGLYRMAKQANLKHWR